MPDPRTKPECDHPPRPAFEYQAQWVDAQKRRARGEKQLRCLVCQKWIWESEYGGNDDA